MASSVIDRLVNAINAHDLEALTACFAPGYSVTVPAHPARSFTGQERVRSNWERLFQTFPTIGATVTAQVHSGDEIWTEWEYRSEAGNGPQFWQRGVAVVVVQDEVIASARFYMEPVETGS